MRLAPGLRSFCILLLACAFILSPWQPRSAYAFFFGGVSLKDEKEMGKKFEAMMRSNLPMIEDPEISQYVDRLLKRIVRAIPPQPFEFHASVIRHNALNAFAAPGGYVCVFSGLLMNMNDEAELAGVLAHELSHVTQRHMASRMERAQYLTIGSLLAAVAGIAIGGPAGAAAAMGAAGASQSAMLNYSRLDESEADNIGLQYLTQAGYPPVGMVNGFKVLRKKSWLSGARVPAYLSTHPDIGDRINSLSARIATMPGGKQNQHFDNTAFLRAQTLLWGRYGDEATALRRFSGNSPISLMGRGMVLARQNKIPEAARAFAQALAAAPADPLILRESGIFHYRKGNLAQAEQLLASARNRDRNDYMAAFFYARCLADLGRPAEALAHYRDVLRHVPQEADAHEAYAKTLSMTGDEPNAYIHMAYAAIYANNRKLADRYFEQARKFADRPASRQAFQQLEKTYRERKEIWAQS